MHLHVLEHRVALTGLALLVALALLVSLILVFAHLGALIMLWNPDQPLGPVTTPVPAWGASLPDPGYIKGIFLS